MSSLIPAQADHLLFHSIPLDLFLLEEELWLTNKVLGRCLGVSEKSIQKVIERDPERFSEADTRLEMMDLQRQIVAANMEISPDLQGQAVPANTRKRGRGTGLKLTRIWSFPNGCLKVARRIRTARAEQFADFIIEQKDRAAEHYHQQCEHYRLKSLQRENYIFHKRPRLRPVVQGVDAGHKTREIAQAAGYKSLESVRRNRQEARMAGLLNTPAVPEPEQLTLFPQTEGEV